MMLDSARFHNGIEVVASDRVRMEKEENSFRLTFKTVTMEDAGTYQCVVYNASGECDSTATLLVEGEADS